MNLQQRLITDTQFIMLTLVGVIAICASCYLIGREHGHVTGRRIGQEEVRQAFRNAHCVAEPE